MSIGWVPEVSDKGLNNSLEAMDGLHLGTKERVSLPLATGDTEFVSLEYRDGASGQKSPHILLWKDKQATEPRFIIPLKGSVIVNNITEIGPCLYFVASTGPFEFQCSTKEACQEWIDTFSALGCKLLKFTDLYRLTEFIGEGSFAKVYIGRHLFTNEEVVIKAVDKKKVLESNIYTEIEVLRKVSHPYINKLYAAYEQEDFVCLVLEYLRGGELFDYLSNKGPFSEDQARNVMRRLLLALQCLHVKGIVHRDLKTENLILENPQDPTSIKLIDFGLSSTIESPAMKMRCGSPGYVAPEILQDQAYGPKVDIFSSGVILYTLLAGFPPFRGQTVKDILKRNLRCHLDFTHDRWSGVAHSAKDLIGWMCSKNPAKRCAAPQALTHPWFHRVARPLSSLPREQHQPLASIDKQLQQVVCEDQGSGVTTDPERISRENEASSAEGLSNRLKVMRFPLAEHVAHTERAVGESIEVTGTKAGGSPEGGCFRRTVNQVCSAAPAMTAEGEEVSSAQAQTNGGLSSKIPEGRGNGSEFRKEGPPFEQEKRSSPWEALSSNADAAASPPRPLAGPPTPPPLLLLRRASRVRRDFTEDSAEADEDAAAAPARGRGSEVTSSTQRMRGPCDVGLKGSKGSEEDSSGNVGSSRLEVCGQREAKSRRKSASNSASSPSQEFESLPHASPPKPLAAMCLTAAVKDSRRSKRRAVRCLDTAALVGGEGRDLGEDLPAGDGGASPADESLPPAAALGASGCVEETERTLGAVQVSAQPSLTSKLQDQTLNPARIHARGGVSPVDSVAPPDNGHRSASSSSRERTQLARRLHSQVYSENCGIPAAPATPDTQQGSTLKPPRLLHSVCSAAESGSSRRGISLSKAVPFRFSQCSEFTKHSSKTEGRTRDVSPLSRLIKSAEPAERSRGAEAEGDQSLANSTTTISSGRREPRHWVAAEKTKVKSTLLGQESCDAVSYSERRQGESKCEDHGCTSVQVLDPENHTPSSSGRRGRSDNLSRGPTPLQTLQNRLSEIISLPGLCRVATAFGAREWLKAKGKGAIGSAEASDESKNAAEETKRPSQLKRQFNKPSSHSEKGLGKRQQNPRSVDKREDDVLSSEANSVTGVSKHIQEV